MLSLEARALKIDIHINWLIIRRFLPNSQNLKKTNPLGAKGGYFMFASEGEKTLETLIYLTHTHIHTQTHERYPQF